HWEWSLDSGALDWSDELELLTGVAAHQLRDLSALGERAHPDDRKRLMAGLERARETGTKLDLEFRLLAPGGERVLRLVGERGTQGEDAQRVFGVFQDLTDSRRTEALVDFLAMHDELTGLGNRRLFLLQVRNAMDSFRVQQRNVLLVGTIDLSRFGRYNDSLGEALADKLLSLVGQRLKDAVGPVGAEVARIGGDEFAVMVVATDEASAAQRFQALLGKLSEPFRLAEHELFLALSAGFAVFPGDVSDADALLKHAQEAQRNARRTGQPCLRASSDPEVARQQRAQLELERGLHKALERQEFFLLYQPQLDFASGRITGAEALIRWRHPELGVVPPVHFVPLLEETGLIHEVGAWVVQEACRQAAAWERQGLNLRIGINLSPRQFLSLGLFDTVAHACRSAGASPRLIELEITESLAMQDVEHSIQLLEEFRQAGFQIAIDDFGIGHSSMAYLMKFPIDVIKIDRAFVTDITQSMGDRAIVRAIVVLAQALGMSVIAEGVETQRQCDFIEAVGVNEVQGYLLGKPMSAHALEALARDYTRPR
ncbi:bifunctional diguanylate cyclase/phosphodiesterase, partial [Aquabacterium sp. A08]|uniref:putative bifunctional diguanylate cyclase/phosphodiesterase n=1 Tax=Aquabacterium sp. A08 TaxID=2718532 RepID=UPI0014231949